MMKLRPRRPVGEQPNPDPRLTIRTAPTQMDDSQRRMLEPYTERTQGMGVEEFEQQRGDAAPFRATQRSPFIIRDMPDRDLPLGAPPFVKPEKYIELLRVMYNLTAAAAAVLVLPKVNQQRTILTIRNSSTSGGNTLVGMGFGPTSEADALFEIAPGGVLLFDVAVPQDEIWLFSVGGSLGTVGYSLAGTRQWSDPSDVS